MFCIMVSKDQLSHLEKKGAKVRINGNSVILKKVPCKTEMGERWSHTLRNTFISRLFDAGLPLAQIQRCARHGDIRLTTKYGKARADEAGFVDLLDYPGLT